MKRLQASKRSSTISPPKPTDLSKPYGFCCDIHRRDPDTQYNMRNPPFDSSFPESILNSDRPDVKFRIQDIVKPMPKVRGGIFRDSVEVKKAAVYGRSRKGRGPLRWFLEEEIDVARDILAKEKRIKRTEEIQRKIAIERAKKKPKIKFN